MKIGLPAQGKQGRNQRRQFRWDVRATDIAIAPPTGAQAAIDGSDSGYAGCASSHLPPVVAATPRRARRR